MNILGISAYYHDSAACLVRDGEITAACQEERFTRRKHDPEFPARAIRACLEIGALTPADIDLVAFYDKPFVKFERILETHLARAPRGSAAFIAAMPLWIKKKLWIKDLIGRELGEYKGRVVFAEHHYSHAASAFFPSPFPEAAFLTIDGVGEWASASFGVGRGNRIEIDSELKFPHSLGLLYSAFTYYTGFRVNSGEYKVMGLAPYGEPVYVDLILDELIDLKEDGSFRLNMEYFDYCAGLRMTSRAFERLFGGPPRRPESELTRRDMDLARSIQEVTGEIMLRMARHVHRRTGMRRLCLAGGVALNCVGNARVLREGPFEEIWIQPAAGDAGGALGAALFAWHQVLGRPRHADGVNDRQQGSYLGPEFPPQRIEAWLDGEGIPYTVLAVDEIPGRIADLVAAQQVIGWFQGRMEFGPRALGSRSIIGDARSERMQETMNLKIKFRESFRPFAPAVLEEQAADWFDIDRPSPYMLLTAPVRERVRVNPQADECALEGLARLKTRRSLVPAITHVDCSARLQTVARQTNPLFHRLLRAFGERYGCPMVINTSFNVRGEPIVCTPADAYRCFMRTEMDYLLIGRCLLDKREQAGVERSVWMARDHEPD